MEFKKLLGHNLKDDEVVKVLEDSDMDVIYDFDRLHQDLDDRYWAPSKRDGFQFRFDRNQILDKIFLYIVRNDGFYPIQSGELDVDKFDTFDEAEGHFKSKGLAYTVSAGKPGTVNYKWWIRADYQSCLIHYQFKEGRIFQIEIMKNS